LLLASCGPVAVGEEELGQKGVRVDGGAPLIFGNLAVCWTLCCLLFYQSEVVSSMVAASCCLLFLVVVEVDLVFVGVEKKVFFFFFFFLINVDMINFCVF
jgi:hypothetical protein